MIVRPDPETLLATFFVEDTEYRFVAHLFEPFPIFQCDEASISYDDPGQLFSNKEFQGTVQDGQININLRDGVNIAGSILPEFDIGKIRGAGRWEVGN
jgi:hypothetical protein